MDLKEELKHIMFLIENNIQDFENKARYTIDCHKTLLGLCYDVREKILAMEKRDRKCPLCFLEEVDAPIIQKQTWSCKCERCQNP